MAVVAQLLAEIGVDTTKLKSGMEGAKGVVEGAGGFFGRLGGTVAKVGGIFAAVAGAAGLGAFSLGIGEIIHQGMEAQDAQTKLNAAVAATGKTTGVTVNQLNSLTNALMEQAPVDDQVIQGSEAILARFDNIGKDTFPRAEQASLDLSFALGISLTSATKKVGLALQDPIKGITKLHSVGVDLTTQQQALIKHLVKVGDTAGAQKIELDALEKSYGGAAKAAGGTLSGQLEILGTNFQNFEQNIGQAVIPVISKLLAYILPLSNWLGQQLPGAISVATNFFDKIVSAIGPLIPKIGSALVGAFQLFSSIVQQVATNAQPFVHMLATVLPPVILGISGFFKNDLGPALQIIIPFVVQLWQAGMQLQIMLLQNLWPAIKSIVDTLFSGLQPAIQAVLGVMHGFNGSSAVLQPVRDVIAMIGSTAQIVATIFKATFGPAIKLVMGIIGDLAPIVMKVVSAITANLRPAFAALQAAIKNASPFISQIFNALNSLRPIIVLIAGLFATIFVTGLGIAMGAIRGIIGALSGIIQVISGVVSFVTGALDVLVGIFTLNGSKISSGLGKMWDGIKNIFLGAIHAVLGFIGGFVSGIFTWFNNLTGGALSRFGSMIGNLVSAAGQIGSKIITAIASLPGKFYNWFISLAGKIIGGLVDGIKNGASSVLNGLKDLAGNMLSSIGNFFGIHSPSRVFADLGNYMMQGLGQGITGGAHHALDAMAAVNTALHHAARHHAARGHHAGHHAAGHHAARGHHAAGHHAGLVPGTITGLVTEVGHALVTLAKDLAKLVPVFDEMAKGVHTSGVAGLHSGSGGGGNAAAHHGTTHATSGGKHGKGGNTYNVNVHPQKASINEADLWKEIRWQETLHSFGAA